MSSRIGIQQIVSTTQPVGATVGDEWFNPSTGKLYKNIALGGTQVGFIEVPVLSQSVNITNSTNATSTFTGALTVAGGAGVQGNLYVGGTIYGTISGSISSASNLAGGTAGQLAYQSAPGTTAFAGPGTAGQLLVSAGASAPVYTNTASIYVGRATQADGLGNTSTQQVGYAANLLGGTAGQIAYQSAPNTSGFISTATTGNFLQANYAGVPTWTTTASMYVNSAVNAQNLYGGSNGQIPYYQGTGIVWMPVGSSSGQIMTSLQSSGPTWSSTSTIQIGYAVNLLGGTAGQIAYQSAGNTTLFTGPGTYGQFLMSTGASAPVYQSTLTQAGGNIVVTSNSASTSTTTGALQVINGGVGIGGSVYVGNRVGFVNASNVSAVYQYYNVVTNSLDTVFG
jgi:hypothetical protein